MIRKGEERRAFTTTKLSPVHNLTEGGHPPLTGNDFSHDQFKKLVFVENYEKIQLLLLLQMHMNGLVNTCLDNPQRLDKPKLVRSNFKELSMKSCIFVAFR